MAAAVAASLDTYFGDAGANSSEAVCNAAAVEDKEEEASQEEAHPMDVGPSSSEVVDCNAAPKEEEEASQEEAHPMDVEPSSSEVLGCNAAPKEKEEERVVAAGAASSACCEMCQQSTHSKWQCPLARQALEDLERAQMKKEKALAQREKGPEPWQQVKPAKQPKAAEKQQKGHKGGPRSRGVQAPVGRVLIVDRNSGAVRPNSHPTVSSPPSSHAVGEPRRASAAQHPSRPGPSNRGGLASAPPPGKHPPSPPPMTLNTDAVTNSMTHN